MPGSPVIPAQPYLLPHDNSELERCVLLSFRATKKLNLILWKRLNIQHEYLKKFVYDGKLVYDDEVAAKLRQDGGRVLDNGTGTGKVPRKILNLQRNR